MIDVKLKAGEWVRWTGPTMIFGDRRLDPGDEIVLDEDEDDGGYLPSVYVPRENASLARAGSVSRACVARMDRVDT